MSYKYTYSNPFSSSYFVSLLVFLTCNMIDFPLLQEIHFLDKIGAIHARMKIWNVPTFSSMEILLIYCDMTFLTQVKDPCFQPLSLCLAFHFHDLMSWTKEKHVFVGKSHDKKHGNQLSLLIPHITS